MKVKFLNFTPHNIRIQKEDGRMFTLPPSGQVVRIEETFMTAGRLDGIEIHWVQLGKIIGLPPEKENIILVVPHRVAQIAARRDVYSPGPENIDEHGQSNGYWGLQRHA